MPRTTLDLDASVLRELRRRGARERKSMGRVASEALAAGLCEQVPRESAPLCWPSRHMGTPRVDLDDRKAVGRMLDGEYLRRRRHGVRTILTHDRDFRRFDGIHVRDPFG